MGSYGGIRGVRVTIRDGENSAVTVEYEDGATHLIVPHDLKISSPIEPGAAKIQVFNLLKRLGEDLQQIELEQIAIEWWPAG
jgi:hypothetical protein